MIGLFNLIKYSDGKAKPKLIAPKIETAFNPLKTKISIRCSETPWLFISTKEIIALKA